MEIDEELVEESLEYYGETQGILPEKLEEVGDKYREQGFLTREQLYKVAYMSSTRSAYHVKKNPEKFCKNVTENSLKVKDDFSKIGLITLLKGFKAPTASCVLTAYNPEKHAVVDTRVWATLERAGKVDGRKESFSPRDYVEMIEHIREISEKLGYTTEEIGYALFAYDAKVREGTLH